MRLVDIIFWTSAVWLVLIVSGFLVWLWWIRRDTRRYREYLHRSGQATIPSPMGRINVPSDDELRAALRELDLPTEGNPDGETSENGHPAEG